MNKHQTPIGHAINSNRIPNLLKETKEQLLQKIDDTPRRGITVYIKGQRSNCAACEAQRMGIKSLVAIPHTCRK